MVLGNKLGYYLPEWLNEVAPEEIIEENPELNLPDPGHGNLQGVKERISRKRSSVLNKYVSLALSHSSSKKFVILAIKTIYEQLGVSSDAINGIIDILFSNCETDLEVVSKRLRTYIEHTNFKAIYQKYEAGSSERKLNLIRRFIKGPLVADIGCGSGGLSEAIVRNIPTVRKVIATDIQEFHNITNSLIEFKLQLQPDKIPIESNVLDTVVLIYVLHHVEEYDQENLLKDINRILKKDGNVVILEDTYSNTLQPEQGSELLKQFLKLDNKQKKEVLAFCDWLTNTVFKGFDIAMPFNFKPIEKWESRFNKAGFSVKHKHFLGIPKGSFQFAPRGVFVLEKIANLSNKEKLPAIPN